ncbi:MAG: carbamoyl-phosphate synthase large subunit, partial [Elusimicrobiota bacterium]
MPKRTDIEKILLIGSGPIVIGQACEFDYSGTQACKVLKAEGYKVILLNSNPATIMTDPDIAYRTYIEPITVEFLEKIIKKEKPDALIPTLGGQTALNVTFEAHKKGILKKYNVEVIGAKTDAIEKAENRSLFKKAMQEAGMKLPKSIYVKDTAGAIKFARKIGLPVVIRPSFTLGGAGGSIANTLKELTQKVEHALNISPSGEALVEESVLGWKEFELEVMRDKKDNAVIVCSIENLDSMGVHTGDSITVAPAQTLSDKEYQIMRDIAIKAMRVIGVDTGGSNVQFAVNPKNGEMVIIEINPRVSRSSALASKATGFPIAKIAALLAVGYTLDEIKNDITKKTPACFEPALDYVVVKVPRFTFEKFLEADQTLDTSMKSVGEVMSIGRTFKEALQKAMRSLEIGRFGLGADGLGYVKKVEELSKKNAPFALKNKLIEEIKYKLKTPNCDRIFNVKYALQMGLSVEEISSHSKIDKWFIYQIAEILDIENSIKEFIKQDTPRPTLSHKGRGIFVSLLKKSKMAGFSDYQIGYLLNSGENTIRNLRKKHGVFPVYKLIDTCAGEFESETPYYYSTYETENDELSKSTKKKVVIIGSGPNRIGQGIEFDYCCVQSALSLKKLGYETIMLNCNPETVSTDYDTSDKLYFEPLTFEDTLNVIEKEKPLGTIIQFGGQTPLNLALKLHNAGVKILGTHPDKIDLAEDRKQFAGILKKLKIPFTPWGTARTIPEAKKIANKIGYPVMVRPSYVLGGRAMKIIFDDYSLENFISANAEVFKGNEIFMDKFIEEATEVDVDAVSDGNDIFIAGIMEHIEQAGIHSGDSTCVLPPHSIKKEIQKTICRYTTEIAKCLKVVGLINVQFAIRDKTVFVLEANPRASRTVPFVSKATGIPVIKIATCVILGEKLKDVLKSEGISKTTPSDFSIKESVFPFMRFARVDPVLGPEMRSTGEVMGIDNEFGIAFYKAQIAAGASFNNLKKKVLVSISDRDKKHLTGVLREIKKLGYEIIATHNTHLFLEKNSIKTKKVAKLGEGKPNVVDIIKNRDVSLIINTPSGKKSYTDGYMIRRNAYLYNIP